MFGSFFRRGSKPMFLLLFGYLGPRGPRPSQGTVDGRKKALHLAAKTHFEVWSPVSDVDVREESEAAVNNGPKQIKSWTSKQFFHRLKNR